MVSLVKGPPSRGVSMSDYGSRSNEGGLSHGHSSLLKKKVSRPIRFDQGAERHAGNDRLSYHRATKDPDISNRSNEGGLGHAVTEVTKKKVARGIRFDQGSPRHSGNDRNSYYRAAKDPDISNRSNEGGLAHEHADATKKKTSRPIRFDQGSERHQGNDRRSYYRTAKDPDIATRSNEGGLAHEHADATKKKVTREVRFDQGSERHQGNDRNSYYRAAKDPDIATRSNEGGLAHGHAETTKKKAVEPMFGAGIQRGQYGDVGSYLHFRNNKR